jgi:solute carrier family 25 (mitochondrial carnitine/acylcarnitine transporter), member 20/29
MSAVNMGGVTGLQFVFSGWLKKFATGGTSRRLTSSEEIGTGFLGGAMSGPACSLWELVMIQQQVNGGGIMEATSRMLKQRGPAVLARGSLATCGREGMYTAGYLGIVPTVSRTLEENYGMSSTVGAVIGSIASGLIAATLSHPLDTIKTCMQGDVEQKRYHNMRQTVRKYLSFFFFPSKHTHTHTSNTGKSNTCRIRYSRFL